MPFGINEKASQHASKRILANWASKKPFLAPEGNNPPVVFTGAEAGSIHLEHARHGDSSLRVQTMYDGIRHDGTLAPLAAMVTKLATVRHYDSLLGEMLFFDDVMDSAFEEYGSGKEGDLFMLNSLASHLTEFCRRRFMAEDGSYRHAFAKDFKDVNNPTRLDIIAKAEKDFWWRTEKMVKEDATFRNKVRRLAGILADLDKRAEETAAAGVGGGLRRALAAVKKYKYFTPFEVERMVLWLKPKKDADLIRRIRAMDFSEDVIEQEDLYYIAKKITVAYPSAEQKECEDQGYEDRMYHAPFVKGLVRALWRFRNAEPVLSPKDIALIKKTYAFTADHETGGYKDWGDITVMDLLSPTDEDLMNLSFATRWSAYSDLGTGSPSPWWEFGYIHGLVMMWRRLRMGAVNFPNCPSYEFQIWGGEMRDDCRCLWDEDIVPFPYMYMTDSELESLGLGDVEKYCFRGAERNLEQMDWDTDDELEKGLAEIFAK
jgi:hypothetical protein